MDPESEAYPVSQNLGAPPADQFADTAATLDRVHDGDETAFARLWARYVPGLQVALAGQIRNGVPAQLHARLDSEADDLLQEAMHKGYRALPEFEYRGSGSVLAWLAEILRNEVRNRVEFWLSGRRDVGRERVTQTGVSSMTGVAGTGPGPGTQVGITEERRKVAVALANLDERHHRILFLRFFGGASWQEIADDVGATSADAVRMECAGKALPALAVALGKV